jgi:hypothetical protein
MLKSSSREDIPASERERQRQLFEQEREEDKRRKEELERLQRTLQATQAQLNNSLLLLEQRKEKIERSLREQKRSMETELTQRKRQLEGDFQRRFKQLDDDFKQKQKQADMEIKRKSLELSQQFQVKEHERRRVKIESKQMERAKHFRKMIDEQQRKVDEAIREANRRPTENQLMATDGKRSKTLDELKEEKALAYGGLDELTIEQLSKEDERRRRRESYQEQVELARWAPLKKTKNKAIG